MEIKRKLAQKKVDDRIDDSQNEGFQDFLHNLLTVRHLQEYVVIERSERIYNNFCVLMVLKGSHESIIESF